MIRTRCATISAEQDITFTEITLRQIGWYFWKVEELATQLRLAIEGTANNSVNV